MEVIKQFEFNDNKIAVYGTIDEPLFKAKEVAKILGLTDAKHQICTPLEVCVYLSFKISIILYNNTMEVIKKFDFKGKEMTVYGTSIQPWFKAKTIAMMLGYADTKRAIQIHVDTEDKKNLTDMGGDRKSLPSGEDKKTIFINESGLYALIFGSKKPIAKKFKHWVTSEVLPTIRKTGTYSMEYKTPKPMLTFKIETENDLHKKVVNFIRQYHNSKHLLFNSSLGEYQDTDIKRIDAYQKGYTSGSPDFILFNPTSRHNGLIIEFKTPKCTGDLSEKQLSVINHFKELNYRVIVSNDYDKIIIKLSQYIDKIRIDCNICHRRFKNKKTLGNHLIYFHKKDDLRIKILNAII